MGRRLWQILAGAVIGSAVVALSLGAFSDGRSDQRPGDAPGSASLDQSAGIAPVAFEIERAARENAALAADSESITSRLEFLAESPRSSLRDAELVALLELLATDEPRGALDLVDRLNLGADMQARVFQVWANQDPDAALAELGSWQPPAARREIALGLLPVFGFDSLGIERIAAVFPASEATNFRVDALAELAEQNPVAALTASVALDTLHTQSVAQRGIAEVLARMAPVAGLEAAPMIEYALHRRWYRDQLLDEWAKLDPDAMLDWLESADLSELLLSDDSFRTLATHDAAKLFELADHFGPWQRMIVRRAAIENMATVDPMAAFQQISNLPANFDTNALVANIAQNFATQDPDGALAWAQSMDPRSPNVLNAVLSTIAVNEPLRVADAVIAEIIDPIAANRGEMPMLAVVLGQAMQEQSPEIVTIADRLASHPDPRVRAQIELLVSRWPRSDAQTAVNWVMGNPEYLTSVATAGFASQVGDQSPQLARQTLERLPAALRSEWIGGTASGWAQRDFDAAERWVLAMPMGSERDRGLVSLVQRAANQRTIDARLIDAFSDVESRNQALVGSMRVLGSTNPELGRQLIEQHIDDPGLRQQAEEQLEIGARLPANLILQQ